MAVGSSLDVKDASRLSVIWLSDKCVRSAK